MESFKEYTERIEIVFVSENQSDIDDLMKSLKLEISSPCITESKHYKIKQYKLRQDGAHGTFGQKHMEVSGKGITPYAVNYDGTRHDGSSGMLVQNKVADLLRALGYNIRKSNIIESVREGQMFSVTVNMKLLLDLKEINIEP